MRIWAPVAALVALAGVLGWLMGARSTAPNETAVIARMAALYAEEGGQISDCAARPAASDGLWLVVRCACDGTVHEYFVDDFGRLAHRRVEGDLAQC
ncbi:hypothetical protein M8744_01690 [Lutimaribacter sp. EGI FJ00013]|uniref:Uncharacterized protein n=1 Tax=Lutimaribacter degradans TaxID=2945989 RepID=A0ACC5ZRD4_9RHOB|nr:hypothetical protein [Lutimaribacter sp. EGI FJ00013]MCM2560846.1 hypothetical protein [Lutimaribacter sp. EGI FJ00013]